MSEEKQVNVEIQDRENECFCKSKGFRKFLTVALGSFVGVFFALSLFSALNKPCCPMMGHNMGMAPMVGAHHQFGMGGFHHPKHFDCPCHKKFKGEMKKIKEHQKDFAEKFENNPQDDKD